jgi:hypothetical protein
MARSQIFTAEYTAHYRHEHADSATRYRAVLMAALPAAAILLAAATMMTHLFAA